jgi:hypothetical protein
VLMTQSEAKKIKMSQRSLSFIRDSNESNSGKINLNGNIIHRGSAKKPADFIKLESRKLEASVDNNVVVGGHHVPILSNRHNEIYFGKEVILQ